MATEDEFFCEVMERKEGEVREVDHKLIQANQLWERVFDHDAEHNEKKVLQQAERKISDMTGKLVVSWNRAQWQDDVFFLVHHVSDPERSSQLAACATSVSPFCNMTTSSWA